MKLTPVALIAIAMVGLGCSKSDPNAPVKVDTNDPQAVAKADLTEKLKNMTPEQRAQYVQQNPQEVQGTFSAATSGTTGQ